MILENTNLAITFDDLPKHGPESNTVSHCDIIQKIIHTLQKHKIDSVYGFLNGKNIEEFSNGYKIIEFWQKAGHKIANHTYSHYDLRNVSGEFFIKDIYKNQELIDNISMHSNCYNIFRYPYLLEGETSQKRKIVRDFLIKNNYKIANCTIDYWDFAWNEPVSICLNKNYVSQIKFLHEGYLKASLYRLELAKKLSNKIYNRNVNHILLLHSGIATAMFLNEVLTEYKNAGCVFISLEEALDDEIYKYDNNFISNMGRNLLAQMAEINKIERINMPPHPMPIESLYKLTESLNEDVCAGK